MYSARANSASAASNTSGGAAGDRVKSSAGTCRVTSRLASSATMVASCWMRCRPSTTAPETHTAAMMLRMQKELRSENFWSRDSLRVGMALNAAPPADRGSERDDGGGCHYAVAPRAVKELTAITGSKL